MFSVGLLQGQEIEARRPGGQEMTRSITSMLRWKG